MGVCQGRPATLAQQARQSALVRAEPRNPRKLYNWRLRVASMMCTGCAAQTPRLGCRIYPILTEGG
jgi:hypothetical protein